jgi:hypothetical protein
MGNMTSGPKVTSKRQTLSNVRRLLTILGMCSLIILMLAYIFGNLELNKWFVVMLMLYVLLDYMQELVGHYIYKIR